MDYDRLNIVLEEMKVRAGEGCVGGSHETCGEADIELDEWCDQCLFNVVLVAVDQKRLVRQET